MELSRLQTTRFEATGLQPVGAFTFMYCLTRQITSNRLVFCCCFSYRWNLAIFCKAHCHAPPPFQITFPETSINVLFPLTFFSSSSERNKSSLTFVPTGRGWADLKKVPLEEIFVVRRFIFSGAHSPLYSDTRVWNWRSNLSNFLLLTISNILLKRQQWPYEDWKVGYSDFAAWTSIDKKNDVCRASNLISIIKGVWQKKIKERIQKSKKSK